MFDVCIAYQYRAMAFSGVRSFSGRATGGTRVCSVVMCTGDTIDTCGSRFPTYSEDSTAIFEELVITGSVPTPTEVPELEADDSVFYPVSSLVNIMPLEDQDYTYTVTRTDDVTTYTLALVNNAVELYSFALWGRVFATDGLEADPPLEVNEDNADGESASSVLGASKIVAVVLLLVSSYFKHMVL